MKVRRRALAWIHIGIYTPEELELWKECKIIGVKEDMSMREIVLEALVVWQVARDEGMLDDEE